jgi:hypothetical protein
VAMRIAADYWSLWWLRRVGLIVDGDIPFLLDEFEASQTDDVREKIAFLIAKILDWGPRPDEELIERIFVVGGASKILSAALMPFWVMSTSIQKKQSARRIATERFSNQRSLRLGPSRL